MPGVGRRTAERFAFYILKLNGDDALKLALAISEVKEKIKRCSACCNLTDNDPCKICASHGRDRNTICVVEQPSDVFTIEKIGRYHGLYHVLMGSLSPLKGIMPENLNMAELYNRVKNGGIEEIIIATDSDTDGETTAQYIAKFLKPLNVKVTRLASGIPVGATLEFIDEATILKAFEGRIEEEVYE